MSGIAFISVSIKHRQIIAEYIDAIVETLSKQGIQAKIFVDDYTFKTSQENTMMKQSCADIKACDFVIAEVSHKAVGVAVEVGYAIGIGKAVIYLRHENSEHSTTISGISTHKLVYSSVDDIQKGLPKIIEQVLQ